MGPPASPAGASKTRKSFASPASSRTRCACGEHSRCHQSPRAATRERRATRGHNRMGARGAGIARQLFRSARAFETAAAETVLDAALRAGLDVSHRCLGGNCGACRARLLEGEVAYPNGRPLGLSDDETADGLVLLCRAHARSDLLLESFAPGTEGALRVKRLPCRVERVERLGHDVMGVYLRLPPAESFDFKPGQYVDVMLSKGRRRSFSIASPPHEPARSSCTCAELPEVNFRSRCLLRRCAAPCCISKDPSGTASIGRPARRRRCCSSGAAPASRRSRASCATFSRRACLGT